MNKLFSLLALTAIALFAACSPKTTAVATATSPAPAAAQKFGPTAQDTFLLWSINGPGVANESYLFGTIHIIPEEDYFLPRGLVKSLNDADEVIFEIDPRQMSDPGMLMGLLTKINMRGDTSLEDLLPKEQYDEVEAYFTKMGMPFFLFKRMKPLFLSAMVGQDMEALKNGGGLSSGGTKSYELELTELAEAGEKAIGGLETMEFQLGLFDAIPYTAQAKMLFQSVVSDQGEDASSGISEMDKVVGLYKRKAIAEMAASFTQESSGVAEFEELLLTKRNENWVPQIMAKIKANSAQPKLFAVGAGHLGGEKGVISLLRQEGLTVEPVR
ncbi:TraB/GumN family protein [Neolewinella persica]|uniref:TraB/GumN family protein n=1 Tax=Neolewinella persica TaxID=70998 RepID=UPI0003744524|nr:TraB/GumN family protein [Neolewinella persica]